MATESTGAKRLRDLTADFQDGVGQRLRSERERHGLSLRVTIGFDEEHELGPGDSIAFESSRPHRLENAGSEPVEAIWFVVGRSGSDARKLALDSSHEPASGSA